MHNLHDVLYTVTDVLATLIEFWGIALVFITVVREVLKTVFKYRLDMHKVARDEGLNHGLASALEVLLAAEILKTLMARTPQKLAEVAALVVIRITIAFLLHWELRQKALEDEHAEQMEAKEAAKISE